MTRFIEPHTLLWSSNVDDIDTQDLITSMKPETPMQRFYKGANIFITGGTGFMGKVLTEKLLRSFPEIDTIYLLMREKKGQKIEARMDSIFNDALFYKLMSMQPKFRFKVRAVTGDCALPGLGLSPEERSELIQNVDVVFHGAATVRFDEKMRLAVGINVNGVRDILILAKQMKKLKAVVHISTAYCNCHLTDIEEKFYEPPMPYQKIIGLVDSCSDDILDAMTPRLLDSWPNTYAFTKALAEDIVHQEGGDLPIVVFRPAIVVGIKNDPLPGWIDNLYGPTGVLVGAGTGVLKTLHADPEAIANIVPVDMAVNAIIACAWDVANTKKSVGDEIPIYNYVSSCEQPLTWLDFLKRCEDYGHSVPAKRAIWYYSFTPNKFYWVHWLYTLFLHFIPALFIDALRTLQGKQPKLWKIYKKIEKFSSVISYFSTKTWHFTNKNTQELWKRVDPGDQQTFMFDMRQLDWKDYFYTYIRGCRVFLAKDDLSTVPEAIIRWRRLYWLHMMVKTVSLIIFLRVAWFLVIWTHNAIDS